MAGRLEIILDADGGISVEAFELGEDCLDASKFLERLFGKAESQEIKQEEFNQKVTVQRKLPAGYCG